ncbi:hypothetical protein [Streptomyces lydicus]|uniref:DUF732 domain-containing protein n=1 Tax=Streptomyces lydicus TaxID=47763 RepID=A0A1D7VH76_9ACTN|nr:hypothetical protein [Streptomyces lydicus]AOP46094.1 hypothetical protein SL103_07430 [Streptomyces lydicus]
MHIRTAAIAVLAAGLLLTACGSDQAEQRAKPSRAPSDEFLGAIVDHPVHSWDDKGPTQRELLAYPPKWCEALKQGHSVDYLFSAAQGRLYPIGEDWGTEKSDAYQVLIMAVKAYCPPYHGRVVQELRDSGVY